VPFADLERNAPVGHDLVEVLHQIRLSHDRESHHVRLGHPIGIDLFQPLAVPWRTPNRRCHQRAQRTQPLRPEPTRRPLDPRPILGQHRLSRGDVKRPQLLILAETAVGPGRMGTPSSHHVLHHVAASPPPVQRRDRESKLVHPGQNRPSCSATGARARISRSLDRAITRTRAQSSHTELAAHDLGDYSQATDPTRTTIVLPGLQQSGLSPVEPAAAGQFLPYSSQRRHCWSQERAATSSAETSGTVASPPGRQPAQTAVPASPAVGRGTRSGGIARRQTLGFTRRRAPRSTRRRRSSPWPRDRPPERPAVRPGGRKRNSESGWAPTSRVGSALSVRGKWQRRARR